MKLKYPINLHKGLTFIFVLSLMFYFNVFHESIWLYLALHGTYGILWIAKDLLFPDKQWDRKVSIGYGLFTFFGLTLYWISPLIIVWKPQPLSPELMAGVVTLNIAGVFLHFGSDAQKYFSLKYNSGKLITEGFFKRTRNANYLGELMIYLSFALLSQHWVPILVIILFFSVVFVPNMVKKDRSLSRYTEFEVYKKSSGFFLPKLF